VTTERDHEGLRDALERAPARSHYRAMGLGDEELARPLIGVATTWTEVMPCNLNQRALAERIKVGVRRAGGTPFEFNTIAVSDNLTQGKPGARASLVSREVIADSIELVVRAHYFDGLVALAGCDKTVPGVAMAACRLDLPTVLLYGGSMAPGRWRGRDVTIQDLWEGLGELDVGRLRRRTSRSSNASRARGGNVCGPVHRQHHGPGARLPRALAVRPRRAARARPEKGNQAEKIGTLVMDAVRADRRPSTLVTRDAIENAITAMVACGGSTNGILHLLAIAREARVPLDIDDFDAISGRVPDHRRPQAERALRRRRSAKGPAGPSRCCASSTTATSAERSPNDRRADDRGDRAVGARHGRPGGRASGEPPVRPGAAFAILRGNLAPEGCVLKLGGHEDVVLQGPARVFDDEEDCVAALRSGAIVPGEVLVLRYEGPAGGPGMRELLAVTSAVVGQGLGESVTLITDGRFSGVTRGADVWACLT
jgi:dihydroxy-acid dehydratase